MRLIVFILVCAATAFSQMPPIEPGVSQELAKWRASQYSNISYKLNLTLEKMSPVLKGTIEIHVTQAAYACAEPNCPPMAIILDWRRIKGADNNRSSISNVTLNGKGAMSSSEYESGSDDFEPDARDFRGVWDFHALQYEWKNEHLIFRDGVKMGENVIKLDFTSPILTSGSAITRYVDKEDGAEYIYSLFVPSDASTAFPVFDQPDLKARFSLDVKAFGGWKVISNAHNSLADGHVYLPVKGTSDWENQMSTTRFAETKPISTYVFAFAAGPFEAFADKSVVSDRRGSGDEKVARRGTSGVPHTDPRVEDAAESFGFRTAGAEENVNDDSRRSTSGYPLRAPSVQKAEAASHIYVRKSQAAKFKPHAAEVFRLNREAVKYLETYFDYKFPWPKYDLVLIPEFPFGGMEHAGATFLREQSVIFPQEPTKNDIITRANLIFHEAAHQWFGDTVTMKWFDDLWLKEGFATFMAYKALDKIMPEANAWKVFYERVKQAAYRTDSTRGTTAIYQPIANLSAAKSAYGNIVYNKAPAFLRQAEFYLGEDKFQTAVRAFLKKHEFANAGWEDLVTEFQFVSGQLLTKWGESWIKQRGMYVFRSERHDDWHDYEDPKKKSPPLIAITPADILGEGGQWTVQTKVLLRYRHNRVDIKEIDLWRSKTIGGRTISFEKSQKPLLIFPNYQDYGYGIFLLDDKSRDYVLKNIGREKDDFLRTMMWGSLWDSVREAELDPKDYVELVIKNLSLEKDEGTIQTLLGRVTTAMNYYLPALRSDLHSRLENLLIDRIENASSQGQRITYYRAFLNIASTDKARGILKQILKDGGGTAGGNPSGSAGAQRGTRSNLRTLPTGRVSASDTRLTLKTKDKFDIVTRLAILGDPDAARLLADLEKTETSDDAKRYAYAGHAAFATAENKAKFWNDFINNKAISESWIEAAAGPFNSIQHSELTLTYLEKALAELPKLKRERKIFFINDWLGDFIGGQRDEKALTIVNKFLTDNPTLDNDLRLKILENSDLVERAVRIRAKFPN